MALKDRTTAAKADLGIDVEIFGPDGESTGITMHVLGSDSQVYLDTERKIQRRTLELGKRNKDYSVGLDPDQQQSALVEKMTACVTSWKEKTADGYKATITLEEGVELECTPENVKKILKEHGAKLPAQDEVIREKVRNEVGSFLFKHTERRPMVLPVIIEV